ncbi:MAG: HD domain-containing protein [Phycisphaerae bacterium]|jgi:HD-GYP domain-containing protein (c-di-GMP phosphodiesterase class II)|nr:HD domain-containing protein [Phycisphaerae bacterium]
MINDPHNIYVSDLAEQLAAGWSKIGAVIGIGSADQPARLSNYTSSRTIEQASQNCIAQGQPIYFNEHSNPALALPVFIHGRCLGCLLCILPTELSAQSEGLFDIFTRQMRQLQQNIKYDTELTVLSQELSQSYEELSLIYKLGQHLQISEDPQLFFQRFVDDLLELIGAQKLMLLIRKENKTNPTWYAPGPLAISDETGQNICDFLLSQTKTVHKPILFSTNNDHPELKTILDRDDYGILAWPVCSNGNLLGILVAMNTDPNGFDSTAAQLLGSIAEHTGSFFQNRFLLSDIQELLTGLLTSFVNAIDAKDPYTRGHSQRVAYISQSLAESLKLSKKECAEIYMAGLLHDIGKIGIGDEVLSKPGKLTEEEFAAIRQHPVIGSRIISSIKQLRKIIPGVLNHHERYDGTGYPEGLKDQQIPLMGSIVGLADCFDAITSDRTYHHALGLEQALTEIHNGSAKQFSPLVVKALLDCDLEHLVKNLKTLTNHPAVTQIPAYMNWFELCG